MGFEMKMKLWKSNYVHMSNIFDIWIKRLMGVGLLVILIRYTASSSVLVDQQKNNLSFPNIDLSLYLLLKSDFVWFKKKSRQQQTELHARCVYYIYFYLFLKSDFCAQLLSCAGGDNIGMLNCLPLHSIWVWNCPCIVDETVTLAPILLGFTASTSW